MNPLVSVIIACYNTECYLSETLDSVFSQTYSNWECVIINDGSTDDLEILALDYVNRDTRFKYLYQPNQGPSMARNNGIELSHGEYILPLDSDDIIAPTYLEKAVSHFLKEPQTKLVYCRADKFGEDSGEWLLPYYSYDNLIRSNCLFVTALFRRKDFDSVGGYNPEMRQGLEDWEFWLELLGPNDVVYRIDEVLFHYRIRKKSRTTEACQVKDVLCSQIRALHSPEYQFALERFSYRKDILTWPLKVFSKISKARYKQFYGDAWRAYRIHDIKQCITYPYMVVFRRIVRRKNV